LRHCEESLADFRRDGFVLFRSLLKPEERFMIVATFVVAPLPAG
jgi:hypothetical protein